MAIRAVVVEDLEDEGRTAAIQVANGKVSIRVQHDEYAEVVTLVTDIRDIMSAITFLDSADKAPELQAVPGGITAHPNPREPTLPGLDLIGDKF